MSYSLTYGVRNRMLWKDRKILKLLLAGFGFFLQCATTNYMLCIITMPLLSITLSTYNSLIKHWSSLKEELVNVNHRIHLPGLMFV